MDEHRARNDASRERLSALLARVSDAELSREIGGGWTVAAGLAHLAFWDRATLLRWRKRRGGESFVWVPEGLTDVLNDAGLPQWRALDPRAVAADVLAAAEELDREIASLPSDLVAEAKERYPRAIERSVHRLAHVVDIERATGSSG